MNESISNSVKKNMKKSIKNNYLIIYISAICLLTACSDNRPPEEIVAERAQARWDFLVARDFQEAWSYHTPGFREKTEAPSFRMRMAQRPIRWDSAQVTEVECDGEDKCEVSALITYTATGAPGALADMQVERENEETWLRIGGQWWYTSGG